MSIKQKYIANLFAAMRVKLSGGVCKARCSKKLIEPKMNETKLQLTPIVASNLILQVINFRRCDKIDARSYPNRKLTGESSHKESDSIRWELTGKNLVPT